MKKVVEASTSDEEIILEDIITTIDQIVDEYRYDVSEGDMEPEDVMDLCIDAIVNNIRSSEVLFNYIKECIKGY